MDTSIIVVIAIIVVFAVVVPTMIRKSATELSRVEIDTVPDEAQIVPADPHNPGHDHSERAKVFQSAGNIEPTVPRLDVAPLAVTPEISLSAQAPEFSIIAGHADANSTADPSLTTGEKSSGETISTTAEAEAQHQRSALPVAVGETRSAFFDDHSHTAHERTAQEALASGAAAVDNVRMLHPAVHQVFNQSQSDSTSRGSTSAQGSTGGQTPTGGQRPNGGQRPTVGQGSAGGKGHLGDDPDAHSTVAGTRQQEASHDRSAQTGTTDTSDTTRRGTQVPNPTFGAEEDHSMTEKATRLREAKKSLGARTRGFALLFLASALGVPVTGVLALFSVVNFAVTGMFLGLAVVSLVVVRNLNLRKREIKARLRALEGSASSAKRSTPNSTGEARPAPAGTVTGKTTTRGAAAREGAAPEATAGRTASDRDPARAAMQAAMAKSAEAETAGAERTEAESAEAERAEAKSAEAERAEAKSAETTKAAQARAVMERNVNAKQTREEADTGEIALVRIRNEAAEGHTTRQVLLTGPIPIVEEAAPEAEETDAAAVADAAATDREAKDAATTDREARDAAADSTTRDAATAGTAEKPPTAEAKGSTARVADAVQAADSANPAGPVQEKESAREANTAPTAVTAPETDSDAATDTEVAASTEKKSAPVRDPFMQRLNARDAWSPTPLPVPSYVDAPQVEHPAPVAKAADASSYEIEARSHEDIAAQFAAELGYRPELDDSAHDTSPMPHARNATRPSKALELNTVDDVLARRRA